MPWKGTTTGRDALQDAEAFAKELAVPDEEREKVVACLARFPAECKSRGMFFEGVLESVRQGQGAEEAKAVLASAGVAYRVQSFGQYPHRDFYKIFYRSARVLHPSLGLGGGLERIAEGFYPLMFARSLAGKTMALLMNNDPVTVLARFVDAYRIATTWNEHRFERGARGVHHWHCRVEPCAFYPRTFQGICRGMVKTVTGVDPEVSVEDVTLRSGEHRYVFAIRV
jgi:uncharacterized protein (TIGR02265 family)